MMASKLYSTEFFNWLVLNSAPSASVIVPAVIDQIGPKSVVDVGCGVGTWLKVFEEHGIIDLLGIDGAYVDINQLQIRKQQFYAGDISKPLCVNRTFDLAICLEAAEHLSAQSAATIVRSLTQLAPVVLFSAAVPGQGGVGHINEQFATYWARLFKLEGYELFDCIRPLFWQNAKVAWYYRQNMFIYIRADRTNQFSGLASCNLDINHWSLAAMHPEMYWNLLEAARPENLRILYAIENFCVSLRAFLRRRLTN